MPSVYGNCLVISTYYFDSNHYLKNSPRPYMLGRLNDAECWRISPVLISDNHR